MSELVVHHYRSLASLVSPALSAHHVSLLASPSATQLTLMRPSLSLFVVLLGCLLLRSWPSTQAQVIPNPPFLPLPAFADFTQGVFMFLDSVGGVYVDGNSGDNPFASKFVDGVNVGNFSSSSQQAIADPPLVVDSQNRVYIPVFGGLLVLTADNQQAGFIQGVTVDAQVYDMSIDASDNLYILSSAFIKYSPGGAIISSDLSVFEPLSIAADSTTGHVYALSFVDPQTIGVFDSSTLTLIDTLTTGFSGKSVRVNSNGQVFVSDNGGNVVQVSPTTGAVLVTYSVPSSSAGTYGAYSAPGGFAVLGAAVYALAEFCSYGVTTCVLGVVSLEPVLLPPPGFVGLLLSTGLTASGDLATVDQTFDPSWSVYPQAGGPAQQAEILFSVDPNWPIDTAPYADNGPLSNWITRDSQVIDNGPAPYSFNRTFVLSADVDLSSVSIEQGQWAIGDAGTIVLNGITIAVSVPVTARPWLALTNFTAPAGTGLFQYGVNVLQLVITSSNDYYEAARLEGILTYQLLPATSSSSSSSTAVPPSLSVASSSSSAGPPPSVSSSISPTSSPPSGSVLGDPAFVGLLGQSYQVHGVSGLTYALVSDRQVVVNAVFTYLSGGSCLHDSETGLPLYVCWSHAGSYLSAVSVRLASGETLVVRAGGAAAGFAAVELGGAGGVGGAGSAGGVGGAASADGADGTGSTDGAGGAGSTDSTGSATALTVGSHTTLPSGLTVDYHSLRQLTVRSAGLYQLTLQNSDGFVNLLQLAVSGWSELVGSVQSHGLIGQTWRRRAAGGGVSTGSIPHIEGEVDDYVVRDGLLGCDFMYSKMAC